MPLPAPPTNLHHDRHAVRKLKRKALRQSPRRVDARLRGNRLRAPVSYSYRAVRDELGAHARAERSIRDERDVTALVRHPLDMPWPMQ
eukprot:CAMPEP_0181233450 /NCGR_PEP_ID=MMETSP1096-20121128/36342_1 /TAXON_ID=156174 ORGANISM="Chrysochromulina ericina, Strain CCMP281" /NCGR_SAMPLE_ID=MMETSP1096 /ASSEMBLY_ACC=CAM_ASM_000453 /LENGTH=87 /DNA_ID=CAMNT_0023327951 /DNA_START=705 /DNA_END=968 /DNA_ORIENTATION=+